MDSQRNIAAALAEGGALHALTECKSFLVYELVWNTELGKNDKKPRHPLKWAQRQDLLSAEAALDIISKKSNPAKWGVGFVIHKDEPFFCIDLDDSYDPVTREWSERTKHVLGMLPGAAMELSTNGKGCHFFARSSPLAHVEKPIGKGLEIYGFDSERHFMALTGDMVPVPNGSADTDCTLGFMAIVDHFKADPSFHPRTNASAVDLDLDEPVPEWHGPLDDDDLVDMMMRAKPKLVYHFDLTKPVPPSDKATFKQLFTGDAEALGAIWPPDKDSDYWDGSSADLSLCNKLAFYTGKNPARMLRIWRASGCWREKLDTREDLWGSAISKAIAACGRVLGEDRVAAKAEAPPEVLDDSDDEVESRLVKETEGYVFYNLTELHVLFSHCTYVRSLDKIFMANGEYADKSRFNNMHGGYDFEIDRTQKVTKNAWEAFLQNKALKFPQADRVGFRPDCPPHEILRREGLTEVNSYIPVRTPKAEGDVAPFLDHLAKMLPVERDRRILLTWMAALVQKTGVKFRWAPVLQGAEGNGKSLILSILRRCIGNRYFHAAQAADIGNKFNDWLSGKLLIGVDELDASGDRKVDILSALLPMITETVVGVQGKGKDAVTATVCANFFFTTNVRAALGQSVKSRRYALFYTAQQSPKDVADAGMDGKYFNEYAAWLNAGGYAFINSYLSSYVLDEEFNPAGECVRAPHTSSFTEALGESLGTVEQEILNAIDEGKTGFVEPWVSGHFLHELLCNAGLERRVPRNKRREVMQTLGYDWHLGLTQGRTDNPVEPDAKKTVLYVKNEHPINELRNRSEIYRRYTEAQKAPGFGNAKAG